MLVRSRPVFGQFRAVRTAATTANRVAARGYKILRSESPKVYCHATGPESSILSLSADPKALHFGSLSLKEQEVEPAEGEDMISENVLKHFKSNSEFVAKLHHALKQTAHNDPMFASLAVAEAKTNPSGFFHIYDLRSPPVYGRIPEVEDIIGTVQIHKEGIVSGSYEPNAMYRLVTRQGYVWPTEFISREI